MDGRQAINGTIEHSLALVLEGTASSTALHGALLALGRAGATWARPAIEPYLTHADASLRQVALRVLVSHLRLADHWATALRMLAQDPDDAVRMTAATVLGALQRDTGDRRTLEALAPFVADAAEDSMVREAAYLAMRAIVRYNPKEQLDLSARDMDLATEVDWAFVNSYLHPPPDGGADDGAWGAN